MSIIIYIAMYTIINLYICFRIIKWVDALTSKLNTRKANICKVIIGTIYFALYLAEILGYFLPISSIQKEIKEFANHFLGMIIYMLLVFVPTDIIKIIAIKIFKVDKEFFKSKRYIYSSGIIFFIIIFLTVAIGSYSAKNITVKEYNVTINKPVKDISNLKIALIADTHLGYSVGYKMMEQMVDKINKQNVDLVVLAGDIFEPSTNTVDDIEKCKQALSKINSKYGVYATFGNHDIEEKLFSGFSSNKEENDYRTEEMNKFLTDSGIKILDDEVIKLFNDSLYIIGRKDSEKPGFGTEKRKEITDLMENVDTSKPVIVIEHEPRNLENISKLGVDLHLAGHTHAGQLFPLTIGTNIMWKNAYGILKVNDMTSIVTSGIGVFGINLRVGTKSEISIVNVNFQN